MAAVYSAQRSGGNGVFAAQVADGASIPATVLPAGVQATAAVGAVSARGAAVAQPAGVTATGAVGAPVAIAGTSIPATVLPAGVQAASAVGTPTVTAAAIAQPLGVAAIAYVGTPTIATGVSGVAVAYPAGVQAIGQVGTLIATGAAWTAAVGVQAVASVGAPFAYEGVLVSTTKARPAADVSNTGWAASTGSDLYAMLDEATPDALDYISTNALGSVYEAALNPVVYPGGAVQRLRFRASSSTGHSVIVRLRHAGATVRSVTQALTDTDTEYSVTLTAGEIAGIASGVLSVQLESA